MRSTALTMLCSIVGQFGLVHSRQTNPVCLDEREWYDSSEPEIGPSV